LINQIPSVNLSFLSISYKIMKMPGPGQISKPIAMVLLFCLGLLVSCQQKDAPRKPNILFILADDLGYHDLNCMGSEFYETPNIDRIGLEGMIFTEGHATCQVCSPSRASIMTGQFPGRHGITDWIGAPSGTEWRKNNRYNKLLPADYLHNLPHAFTTLPEALKEAGYLTFFAGKWHLGSEGSYPEDHGFDFNEGGFEAGSPRGGYFSPYNNPKLQDGEPGENLSMRLARETAQFIRENKDTSFFAYLSFYAVHGPIQTTREKWDKYRQKAEEQGIKESGYIMERRLPIRQVQDNPIYGGLVQTMDEAVGLVLACLEELGLEDNTIVIFTSDNGGVSSGDSFSTSNLPLRGGKGYQWEGGIREPYFIKVPWLGDPGSTCDVPVTGTDFYPTLLELVGADLKPDQHIDGVSLVPLLTGGSIPERPLFWHYPHYGNQGGDPSSIVREGEWKLIHYWENGLDELYNLRSDPGESRDVSAEHPEITASMGSRLKAWLEEVDASIPVPDPDYDEELFMKRQEEIRNGLWPRLEQDRLNYLSPD
jgi:arylsulfatase A-like enzyme